MTLRFADVSHIRLSAVTNWSAFLGSVDGLGLKCTQHTDFADPAYRDGLARARAAGKLILHYHYVGPSPGAGAPASPAAETSWFLRHLDWRPGEILATDWEPQIKPADSDGYLAEFNARMAAALGPVPVSYMNSFEAKRLTWAKTRAGGSAWWAAQYGINNGQPGTPPTGAWPAFAAWQFTSAALLPGIAGGTDLSLFYGDRAAWLAYGNGTSPGGLTLATLTDTQATQLYTWIEEIAGVLGNAYDGPGDDAGTKIKGISTVLGSAYDGPGDDIGTKVKKIAAEMATLTANPPSPDPASAKSTAEALVAGLPPDVVAELRRLLAQPAAA